MNKDGIDADGAEAGETHEFQDQVRRLAAADEGVTAEEWNRYYDRLLAYARRSLRNLPRRAVDEEDVAVSAMNSFFMGIRDGRFLPQDRDELWRLLATITVRKATKQLRLHYAAKRGGGQVRGESVFLNQSDPDSPAAGINNVMDDGHLPEMSRQLTSNCNELLERLEDDVLRQFVTLRLEGLTIREIATRMECSPATVKRKLERVRKAWTDAVDE